MKLELITDIPDCPNPLLIVKIKELFEIISERTMFTKHSELLKEKNKNQIKHNNLVVQGILEKELPYHIMNFLKNHDINNVSVKIKIDKKLK